MARYTEASCKLCRRHGEKLFLKGNRCETDKCAVGKRPFAPGQHGKTRLRRKFSNYGLQMQEKQKVRRIYGVLEKQFRIYFHNAAKSKGVTGEVLLQLLERRLDNVMFRVGFGLSRNHTRQLVKHNLVKVNSRNVNIPSYLVKVGDKIEIKPKEKLTKALKENLEQLKDRKVPEWIKRDDGSLTAEIVALPNRDDIGFHVNENLIVELYSK